MVYRLDPERVTKQLLLSSHTEEEYMSFYLGIIPDKQLHCNPLRVDKKPTASFYRCKNNELVFKDFQTGFHGNFVDIVMEKFKVDYHKALRIVANDFNLITKHNMEKNVAAVKYDGSKVEERGDTKIQCEVQEFTPTQLKWWNSYGISLETLKKFNVFSVKHVFLNGSYLTTTNPKNPIYGYYFGKEEGRELWKIYFPLRLQFRFLLNTSKLQGAKQLPATGEYVVVTKSMKDVMCLHELGVPAVAPQAESVIIHPSQYKALKRRFKYVIFNADWDRAGQRFMIESRKKFGAICLAFKDKELHAKDISDYVKKHGVDAAKNVIAQCISDINAGWFNYQFRYADTES